MYSISAYGNMITDRVRMDAYVTALRQAVMPGSVVVDIGTGTGIFAMLACQFGARRVYAIEPSDAIQVAREIASDNGNAERIEFIQDLSNSVTLPEQADVIISDLRGVLPLFQYHIPSLVDARQRLLKPGGILIPQRDTLCAAIVEAPKLYEPYNSPWDENIYGFTMQKARQIVTNTWRKCRVTPDQLLVEPQRWTTLDYTSIENTTVNGSLRWTAGRTSTAHGLCVWFDAKLVKGIGFSNAPG